MPVVTLSDGRLARLARLANPEGRILRDRLLPGLCLRVGKRSRTFLVATSCNGKQVRVTLGRWPLISVETARALATPILLGCRSGVAPVRPMIRALPCLLDSLSAYALAKRIKPSSLKRYRSLVSTHFEDWLDRPVTALSTQSFRERCHEFAQTNGAALVELGRGLIGALIKYLNAVHGLEILNPFARLAAAGLMPDRAQPRLRRLREDDLPAWRHAVERLPERQRDYLLLLALTGLRRNECSDLRSGDVDLDRQVLLIPETKNGKPHTLPITPLMMDILVRRLAALPDSGRLFAGISAMHVAKMAGRVGAPPFVLHDLRKLLATIGERLAVGDAVLRRILNHTAKRSDALHRCYVTLDAKDVSGPLRAIQGELERWPRETEHGDKCKLCH